MVCGGHTEVTDGDLIICTTHQLYRYYRAFDLLILDEPDPEKAMENYRKGLMLINSQENYEHYLHSGFHVIIRDESRTILQTLELVEKAFGLD